MLAVRGVIPTLAVYPFKFGIPIKYKLICFGTGFFEQYDLRVVKQTSTRCSIFQGRGNAARVYVNDFESRATFKHSGANIPNAARNSDALKSRTTLKGSGFKACYTLRYHGISKAFTVYECALANIRYARGDRKIRQSLTVAKSIIVNPCYALRNRYAL